MPQRAQVFHKTPGAWGFQTALWAQGLKGRTWYLSTVSASIPSRGLKALGHAEGAHLVLVHSERLHPQQAVLRRQLVQQSHLLTGAGTCGASASRA